MRREIVDVGARDVHTNSTTRRFDEWRFGGNDHIFRNTGELKGQVERDLLSNGNHQPLLARGLEPLQFGSDRISAGEERRHENRPSASVSGRPLLAGGFVRNRDCRARQNCLGLVENGAADVRRAALRKQRRRAHERANHEKQDR